MRRVLVAAALAALAAGCIADEPPTLSARNETREVPQVPEWAGLVVRGTLSADDGALTITALARNAGDATYEVETGCTQPWSTQLLHDGERYDLRDPGPRCLAFATEPFPPGSEDPYTVTWDGTYWDPEAGAQLEASEGDWVWRARFVAYRDGAQIKAFDLDFPVTVS